MSDGLVANEHYLNRVVEISAKADVQATEDIMAGNGMKLVAKGTRIDGRAKERLLEHKLRKPLESSVRVIDGAASRPMDKVAMALLDKHALLAGLCGRTAARAVSSALRDLRLSVPLESLLSVYAHSERKLEHAVAISLLGAAAYHDLPEGGANGVPALILAGLMHDIGELYIDPAILSGGSLMGNADRWRHIAAHPIIGARVLRDMPGAGPKVAEAVLYHHERLDGFGYPHGLRGAGVPLAGQILALAEMLMGLLESGHSPHERASVAVKLIPGEFNRRLLDKVALAARATVPAAPVPEAALEDADALAAQAADVCAALQRLRVLEHAVEEHIGTGSAALKELMAQVIERAHRIRQAFSSTGLDTHSPDELRERLIAVDTPVRAEVAIVLREIAWRLREVKRETLLRLERVPGEPARRVREIIEHSDNPAPSSAGAGAVTA